MIWLVLILGVVLAVFWLPFRGFAFNPIKSIVNGGRDAFLYFYRKRYNECPYGELVNYSALFGQGKTLSVVYRVRRMYKRYNGKTVYCSRRKKYVKQIIQVVSNVHFNDIPYIQFRGMYDIVNVTKMAQKVDDDNDTLTVYLFVGDEFSTQMNSRNFKTNLDATVLNSILTCRHFRISLYMTAQRFNHLDALLRQVVRYNVECKKLWRFQMWYFFDAWELENATSTVNIKPLKRKVVFIRNADYNAYDTFAVVDNFIKSAESGDFISEQEILSLRGLHDANMDGISLKHTTKSWRKRKSA